MASITQSTSTRPSRRATITAATVAAIASSFCAGLLVPTLWISSGLWPDYVPTWLASAMEERNVLLAVNTAVCTLLAILVQKEVHPVSHVVTLTAGGLSGFAAVLATIDQDNYIALTIGVVLTFPILVMCTSLFRLPRSMWGWIGLVLACATALFTFLSAIFETSLQYIVIYVIGERLTAAFLIISFTIMVVLFVLFLIMLVVKAAANRDSMETSLCMSMQTGAPAHQTQGSRRRSKKKGGGKRRK